MNEFLVSVFLISLACNVILAWHLWKKMKAPIKQETYDVQALMTDLLHGSALIKIERIAPADVLLRSPRGRG